MDIEIIALLIGTGCVVGVINTFAGAAAAITLSVFSMLGLPLPVANATNRIPVIFQTITTSVGFYRQEMLDWRLGLKLSIPTIVGAVIGSIFVTRISVELFTWLLVGVLILLLAVLVLNPTKALKGRSALTAPGVGHYLVLVAIGFYGGAFHVGVGYLFLTMFIMGLGYDLLTANALKGFVVGVYTVFSLVVFVQSGEVNWTYGLIHGVGNVIGAGFATKYARVIPVALLRYGLIVFIGLTIVYLFIEKI